MAHPVRRTSEIQRINLSFNPKAPFPIRKQLKNNEELVTYLKKLWQQISESSKTPIPLGSRPNVILKMKRDELHVHGFVLEAFSDNGPLWSRFLTTQDKTAQYVLDLGIHAPMLTAEALRKVMQFLYEGTTSFTMGMLPQLLDVAKFFAITEIKQKCGEYIIRYVESNPNTLLSYLQLSYSHDLQADIKDKLVEKAACAFSSYNKGEELMNLSGDVIEALLSSDDLKIPDPVESTKFDFVIAWLKRNPKAAPKHTNLLINACRFDRLTREENLKCFGKARESGIEHLVRKHIMDADWKKTCDEWGQPRKCDCPSPKCGDTIDLSSERRRSTENSGFGNGRESSEKPDENERKQQRFERRRFRSQKSEKSWRMKTDQRSSPDKMVSSMNMETSYGGSSANLLTAKELSPTTLQTPPVVQENFQKEKSKHRKPKRLRSNQLKDKFEKSLNAKPSSKMEKVVEMFTKVLNKKGRRLLQNRLMDPNFSDTFRNAIKGTAATEFAKPATSKNPNMILERDQRLCTIPQSINSGFLYTPESKNYKSYLDVYCKFTSEVGPKPNKTIAKVINGGKPLQLRQSIIHTKINEFGKREATAYEQKFSPTERKKSAKSKLEMNKLSLF